VLVERVGGNGHLHPFPAAGDDRKDRGSGCRHPHVVLQLGHVLFRSRFLREIPRQHELGLEHGPGCLNPAIQGGRHPAVHGMKHLPLHLNHHLSGVLLVPMSVQLLGYGAELDQKVA